jgi:hypothetical protein
LWQPLFKVNVSTSFELAIHVNIAILFFHQIQKVNLQQVLHLETLGNAAVRSSRTWNFHTQSTVPHIRIYNIPGV